MSIQLTRIDDGATLGDILQQAEETPTVDRLLWRFEREWTNTADTCIKRAEELEQAALDLRKRADDLLSSRNFLNDVKQAVLFEIESRNRASSLALVNPTKE